MDAERVGALLTGVLGAQGLELEAVEVARAGRRERVRIVVDGDGPDGTGPSLDEIAAATTAISAALDDADVAGDRPYTLEVSSRGVSRPLTTLAHWRRNRGRLVLVHTRATAEPGGDAELTGRIVGPDGDAAVVIEVEGAARTVELAQIRSAVVQVEFRRGPAVAATEAREDPDSDLDDPDDDDPDDDDPDDDDPDDDDPDDDEPDDDEPDDHHAAATAEEE